MIFLSNGLHLIRQRLQLRQHRVVLLATVTLGRQRVLLIIFTGEGALLVSLNYLRRFRRQRYNENTVRLLIKKRIV
jgi:hypothetical protein